MTETITRAESAVVSGFSLYSKHRRMNANTGKTAGILPRLNKSVNPKRRVVVIGV
jgi:hypothetical protein